MLTDYDESYLNQLYATREKYNESKYDQCKQFDQNMFFISSAIFGISFTFMSNVINKPIPFSKWIIAGSWTFILANIVLSLVSYLVSYNAYKIYINVIDIRIKNIWLEESEKIVEPKNVAETNAERLNVWNISLFGIGLILLVIYICINIFGGAYVS